MTTWADFVPDIAMHAADCPHFTIMDQARIEATDFFRETRIWRSTTPVTIATSVTGTGLYAVTNTSGQEIIGLPTVWQDNIEIKEGTPAKARDYDLGKTGKTKFALMLDGATVQLLPAPDSTGRVIKAIVAYAPTAAATGISDALYALYGRTLRDRILAKLKSMKGKPWADPIGAREIEHASAAGTLRDSTMAGPMARNRLRTKMSVI